MSVRAAHPGAALRVYTFAEARGPRRLSGRWRELGALAVGWPGQLGADGPSGIAARSHPRRRPACRGTADGR